MISAKFNFFSIFFFFLISHEWRKVHLLYSTNGQSQVIGRHTCQLMMKSMLEFIKKQHNITYGTFDIEATSPRDYSEALKDHIGNSYSGELFFLYSANYYTIICAVKSSTF